MKFKKFDSSLVILVFVLDQLAWGNLSSNADPLGVGVKQDQKITSVRSVDQLESSDFNAEIGMIHHHQIETARGIVQNARHETETVMETSLPPLTDLDIVDKGIIDVKDVKEVVRKIGQRGPGVIEDVNRDEVVDIFDVILVSRAVGTDTKEAWREKRLKDLRAEIERKLDKVQGKMDLFQLKKEIAAIQIPILLEADLRDTDRTELGIFIDSRIKPFVDEAFNLFTLSVLQTLMAELSDEELIKKKDEFITKLNQIGPNFYFEEGLNEKLQENLQKLKNEINDRFLFITSRPQFNAVSPLTNQTKAPLAWKAMPRATGYEIELTEEGKQPQIHPLITGTSTELLGLKDLSNYTVRLRARNGDASSRWSEAVRFKVIIPPAIPLWVTKIEGNVTEAQKEFSWQGEGESFKVEATKEGKFWTNFELNQTEKKVILKGMTEGTYVVKVWALKAGIEGAKAELRFNMKLADVIRELEVASGVTYYLNSRDRQVYQSMPDNKLKGVGRYVDRSLPSGAWVFVVHLDDKTQFWTMTDKKGKFLLTMPLSVSDADLDTIVSLARELEELLNHPNDVERFATRGLSFPLARDDDVHVSFLAGLIKNRKLLSFTDEIVDQFMGMFHPSAISGKNIEVNYKLFDHPATAHLLVEVFSSVVIDDRKPSLRRMNLYVETLAVLRGAGFVFNSDDIHWIQSALKHWIDNVSYDIISQWDRDQWIAMFNLLATIVDLGDSNTAHLEIKKSLADILYVVTMKALQLNEPKDWKSTSFDTSMAARFAMFANPDDPRAELLLRQNMKLQGGETSPILEHKFSLWKKYGILLWDGDSAWSEEELVLSDRALAVVTPEVLTRTNELGLMLMNTIGGSAGGEFEISLGHLKDLRGFVIPHEFIETVIHETMHKQFFSLSTKEKNVFTDLHKTHSDPIHFISNYAQQTKDEDAADTGTYLLLDLISVLDEGARLIKQGSKVLEKDLLILKGLIQSSAAPVGTKEQFISIGIIDVFGDVNLLKVKVSTDENGNIASLSLDMPLAFVEKKPFQITYKFSWSQKGLETIETWDNFSTLWEENSLELLNFAMATNNSWFLNRIIDQKIQDSFVKAGARYLKLSRVDKTEKRQELLAVLKIIGSRFQAATAPIDLSQDTIWLSLDLTTTAGDDTYFLRRDKKALDPISRDTARFGPFGDTAYILEDFLAATKKKLLPDIQMLIQQMELLSFSIDNNHWMSRLSILISDKGQTWRESDKKSSSWQESFFDVRLTFDKDGRVAQVTIDEKDNIGTQVGTVGIILYRNDAGELMDVSFKESGNPLLLKKLLNQ